MIDQIKHKMNYKLKTFGIKHGGGGVGYSDDEMFLLQDGQPNAGWQVEVQHGKFGHQTRRTKLFDVG